MKPLYLDKPAVAEVVSLSTAMIERLVREGSFPRPRELSNRRVGWLVREVEEWAEQRPVANMLPPENTGHANRPARCALRTGRTGEH